MGFSVLLILAMVSRKNKYSDIDNQAEFDCSRDSREIQCPEPILIDAYDGSVLDIDNHYQNFKDYKNKKQNKKESNDFSSSTGTRENSISNNVYSFNNNKNGFEYKKLDNDIDDFINEEEKTSVGGKVYHKKDQFLVI